MKRLTLFLGTILALIPSVSHADTTTSPALAQAMLTYGISTTQVDWTTMRSSAAATSINTSTATFQIQFFTSTSTVNPWRNLIRSYFTFDTSNIPDNAVISGVTLRLYGGTKFDGLGVSSTFSLAVVSSTPTNPLSYSTSDFSRIDGIIFASTSYQSWLSNSYNDMVFVTGTNQINVTGNTTFGIREWYYDHNNVQPPTTTLGANTNMQFASATNTSTPAQLLITYTIPPTFEAAGASFTSTNSPLLQQYILRYGRGLLWICSSLILVAFLKFLYDIGSELKKLMRMWT